MRSVITHSITLPSLYLRQSSFSNPSVASPTSQFILQPFFRFSYVKSSSLNSPGELPMVDPVCTCGISTLCKFQSRKLIFHTFLWDWLRTLLLWTSHMLYCMLLEWGKEACVTGLRWKPVVLFLLNVRHRWWRRNVSCSVAVCAVWARASRRIRLLSAQPPSRPLALPLLAPDN